MSNVSKISLAIYSMLLSSRCTMILAQRSLFEIQKESVLRCVYL